MEFGAVIASLPDKKGSAYIFDRGKITEYPHALLAKEIAGAKENLQNWGIGAGSKVGVFAPNCYQWLIYDLAIIALGATSVPFADDFAGKIDRELLDKYQISLLLISQRSVNGPPADQPYIAYIDRANGNVSAIARTEKADPDDLTMAFSSGSAGGLKGLLVSRKGVEETLPPILEAIGARHDDRAFIFMPMSNFQQRMMCYAALWYDYDFILTDYIQVMAGIMAAQPTILIAPPMYYQMIYTRFLNFPAFKRAAWTVLGGLLSLLPGEDFRRGLAAGLFPEFYRQFGGKMRVLITGMAPIKRDVVKFFDRMQLPLCESYGLMETGSLTYRPASSKRYGSVGQPLRGITIEFAEDGEIIVQRENPLTRGYFQAADGESERTFLGNNRIATGDIGKLDSDGYLYLLGRKKELIVTPGGHKIHPEIVEHELGGCPDIAQSAVFLKRGTAMLACVAALNQPEGEEARSRVQEFVKGMKTTKGFPIGEVIFADAPFSAQNGMLRPNLKLDRRAIAVKYQLN